MTLPLALRNEPPAESLRRVLADAHDRRVFSAAAWAVGDRDGALTDGFLGNRAWPELDPGALDSGAVDSGALDSGPLDSGPLDSGTVERGDLFDLASVTKPLVAVALFALLERGALTLGTTVAEILLDFREAPSADATVGSLLLHTSGLPGRVPLYQRFTTRDAMLRGLATLPLVSRPGTRVEYSSQGFMLLGLVIEAVTGLPLDRAIAELVATPAGATTLGYRPAELGAAVVATERCPWRGRVVQGEVHDENAVVLGGVAGHAGLFGSVDDLAAVGRALVRNIHEAVFMAPTTFRVMTTVATGGLSPARTPGWEAGRGDLSAAGDLLGPRSFGHTGFTGTSLFVDPDAGRWYVLLTNRVHPRRDGDGIGAARRAFHNVASLL